jgi:ABC-type multidrug transport system permease subunit
MNASWSRIILFIIGCAIFGVLMGIRAEVPAVWERIAIAAVAGAFLGLAIAVLRGKSK